METNEQLTEDLTPETNTEQVDQVEQEPTVETPDSEQSTSDRTAKQFEKLTESNKKLKQENEQFKNLLDSLKPQEDVQETEQPVQKPTPQQYNNLSQDQIDNVFENMKDEEGYIDGNKLLDTLKDLNTRAVQAEQRAARVEEHIEREKVAREEQQKTQTMTKVHEKYPQLDPEGPEFNPDFYELVRNDLISQMLKGEEDVMKAADAMYKYIDKESMNKEEEQKQQQTKEQRAQINATRPKASTMKGYYTNEEDTVLRQKVQQGQKGALAELLRRRGQ